MGVYFVFSCAFGLLMGSFLNAWIWRTRVRRSIVRGRSVCPSCENQLAWKDNLPLVSFFLLRGTCRYCTASISWQYPLVEVSMGLLFLFFTIRAFPSVSFLLVYEWIIAFCLVAVFVYDFLYKEIWDRWTTIPAVFLGICSVVFGVQSWPSIVIGVLVGAGFFLLQYVVSRGTWIGGGDIRLGVFMGVVLGWPHILVALFIAYMFGAIVSVILIVFRKKQFASETPFGTYLALATFVTYVYGTSIIEWYIHLL